MVPPVLTERAVARQLALPPEVSLGMHEGEGSRYIPILWWWSCYLKLQIRMAHLCSYSNFERLESEDHLMCATGSVRFLS